MCDKVKTASGEGFNPRGICVGNHSELNIIGSFSGATNGEEHLPISLFDQKCWNFLEKLGHMFCQDCIPAKSH